MRPVFSFGVCFFFVYVAAGIVLINIYSLPNPLVIKGHRAGDWSPGRRETPQTDEQTVEFVRAYLSKP